MKKIKIKKTINGKGIVDWKIYVDKKEMPLGKELSNLLTETTANENEGIFTLPETNCTSGRVYLQYGEYYDFFNTIVLSDTKSPIRVMEEIKAVRKLTAEWIKECEKYGRSETIEFII